MEIQGQRSAQCNTQLQIIQFEVRFRGFALIDSPRGLGAGRLSRNAQISRESTENACPSLNHASLRLQDAQQHVQRQRWPSGTLHTHRDILSLAGAEALAGFVSRESQANGLMERDQGPG